ncbi:viral movement protein [Medicago truncatula]|uniref:Viral movement protein n=1 Tax=Medicago truncatula TaxID=3880 RepID=G7ISZ2_MEDTR|nr:viral movement protein [Medicago truncatula]
MTEVSYFEGTFSYYADDIIDNKIEEADLSLIAEENFKRKFNKFKEFFSRKNILKFGIMIGEEDISIENTQGNIVISTIHKTQIEKRIETFSEKEKNTFMKGIDSPLEIALEDSRILDKRQATILENSNFIKKGNHPFTICYRINYTLSNSHHSIEFIGKNTIHIDELFTPLVTLKSHHS